MPKKKSSRPNSNLGSSQQAEPKSATQVRRERTVRIASIVIVLALLLSVLAGALSVTPSQAAGIESKSGNQASAGKSVQYYASDVKLDTDSDGIPNNEDPDIDGDGIVNGVDPDIDGDGRANFGDGDPAETNGIDTQQPNHPDGTTVQNLVKDNPGWATAAFVFTGLVVALIAIQIRRKIRRK